MNDRSIYFTAICRTACCVLVFFLFAGSGLAQEELSEAKPGDNMSEEVFPASSPAESEDAFIRFENLRNEEKREIFLRLNREDQLAIFKKLSEADQEKIFFNLPEVDKKILFEKLNSAEKVFLFKKLNESERKKIFEGLNDADKNLIFESLSDTDKEIWLSRYPGLQQILKEPGAPPPVKPSARKRVPADEKEAKPPSRIEKFLSGDFPTELSRELTQYGYDFFAEDAAPYMPLKNIPVGPDYIIGPEDEFTIHLWGKVEKSYEVVVSRDGMIRVPRLGSLNVSGLNFKELKRYLFHKFKVYYTEFEMDITMGQLRSVSVFVVGEAKKPGTYAVSSLSTIISALYASGGPSKNGSLRNIKLYREGREFTTLDLYEFFIKGLKENDVRIRSGDTIFIPVLGTVVGIVGNVRRPAIYELKGTDSIADIIELAGGVLPTGHLQNVVIERIQEHRRRVIKSFNLDPAFTGINQNLKASVSDGDVIKIYPVHTQIRHVVYLEGHVKYPREYELKAGMRLADLIPSYDALLPEPYLQRAEIIRLIPPDLHPEVVEFNLGALLAGDQSQNLILQDMDRVKIYDVAEKRQLPEVTIRGAIRNPGTYRLLKGMRVKDLIFSAGNFTNQAYLEKATVSRIVPGETGTDTLKISFSPRRALSGDLPDNELLKPDDQVYIREIPQYSQALERKVFLMGEFLFPGEYAFSEGERISSVIERAGGLTEDAYPFGAVFQRESVKGVQKSMIKDYVDKLEEEIFTLSAQAAETSLDSDQAAILNQTLNAKKQLLEKMKTAQPTGRMVLDLEAVLALPGSNNDFQLRSGDRLIVNKKPDYVNVLGEVYNPTAMLVSKDKDVGYYLNRVGGATDNADDGQIYVVKANGSVISKRQEGFLGLASWDADKNRWTMGGFESVMVDPGDTIIVPKKVERYPWLRLTKDITEILFKIAITAGVVVAIY